MRRILRSIAQGQYDDSATSRRSQILLVAQIVRAINAAVRSDEVLDIAQTGP